MRKLLSALNLSILALGCTAAAWAAGAVPRPAAEFVVQHTNGKQTLLSSMKGKPVVLALMYATCSHCQHTAGLLNGIQQDYAAKGVQVLGATFGQGDALRIDTFNKQLGIKFDCGYSDISAVMTFLQLQQGEEFFVPILVFIDKKGVIQKQVIGDEKFYAEKDQPANIRAEVEKLMKGAPSTTSSARRKKAAKSE